jgi:hypothetical protein
MSSQNSDVQENNQQIISDIQSLQNMEQQLFNSLETNPNLSTQQKEDIIQKINQLSNMRINLYKTLNGVNTFYKNALLNSQGTLNEQITAVDIIETELNDTKNRLQELELEKNNKIRLVEINTYFGEKYEEHASLMKVIICILIPVIIVSFLYNLGLLPDKLYYILVVIIAAIGGFYFWKIYASIIMRDNMNYQEYNWYFDPSKAPEPNTESSSEDPWLNINNSIGTCIGSNCCSPDQTYDTVNNKCIDSCSSSSSTSATTTTPSTSSSSTNTESFVNLTNEEVVNKILTKNSMTNKYKPIISDPKPSSSESFLNYKNFK